MILKSSEEKFELISWKNKNVLCLGEAAGLLRPAEVPERLPGPHVLGRQHEVAHLHRRAGK